MSDKPIKERVIDYLLGIERQYVDHKLRVCVSKNTYNSSTITDIEETDLINQLSILETEGYIKVSFRAPQRDLSHWFYVDLLSPILNYYDNKQIQKATKRNNWIQFWIPVCLSAIALAVSIIALLLELQLIQPKQQPKTEAETTDVSLPIDSSGQ